MISLSDHGRRSVTPNMFDPSLDNYIVDTDCENRTVTINLSLKHILFPSNPKRSRVRGNKSAESYAITCTIGSQIGSFITSGDL